MIGRDCCPIALFDLPCVCAQLTPSIAEPAVGIGVIGVGLMGAHHAANLARRISGAWLVGLADPVPGVSERHAVALGCVSWTCDYQESLAKPAFEGVVIASPAR